MEFFMEKVVPGLLILLVLIVMLRLFHKPLRWLLSLARNTAFGFLTLFAFGKVGSLIGVTLGINLVNALVLALLGAPGFGLLLMLRWACL